MKRAPDLGPATGGKILVTGSAGHLGEGLMRTLQATQHDPVGVDIKPSPYTTHVGSITDAPFVHECMQGIDIIVHTATLHKPHVATHSHQDFVGVNVSGTLNLLQAAVAQGAQSLIFTSTTSTFGDTLTPAPHEPAIWVTESTPSIPKNIYGVTKNAAEDLCQLFYRKKGLPCIVLKTSRFFPEQDDNERLRAGYDTANMKANELLYRRVDLADAVDAHLRAIACAPQIGFGKYIVSAPTPFTQDHLVRLRESAPMVVDELFPHYRSLYKRLGWKMLPSIDRVYVNRKAQDELGWTPGFDFGHVLACLEAGVDFRSELAVQVGAKGYHDRTFEGGPYPTEHPG